MRGNKMPTTIRFFSGARRTLKKKEIDKYEDFYERAFSTANIDEILSKGGGAEFQTFKTESKTNTKNLDMWNAMFNRKIKTLRTTRKTSTLGQAIFLRYFEDGQITQNKSNRTIVRTGERIEWNNKTYKGGMYLPKAYLSRRR